MSGVGFGTSTPTAPRPGIGATMRMLCAFIASARSFARFAIWRTFTPGAGSTSNWVTTGPVWCGPSFASTLKMRSVSMSFAPVAASARFLPREIARRRLREQLRRRQLVARHRARAHRSPRRSRSSCSAASSALRLRLLLLLAARLRRRRRVEPARRIDRRHLLRRRLEADSSFFFALRLRLLGRRRSRARCGAADSRRAASASDSTRASRP